MTLRIKASKLVAAALAISMIVLQSSALADTISANLTYDDKKDFVIENLYRENGDLIITNSENVTITGLKLKGDGELVISNCENVTIKDSAIEGTILIMNTKNIYIDKSVASDASVEVINQFKRNGTTGVIDATNLGRVSGKTLPVLRTLRQEFADDFSGLTIMGLETGGIGKYITEFLEEDERNVVGDTAITTYFASGYKGGIENIAYDADTTGYVLNKTLGKYRSTFYLYKISGITVKSADIDPTLIGLGDTTFLVSNAKKLTVDDLLQNRLYSPKPVLCDDDKNVIEDLEVKPGQTYKVRLKFEIPTDFNKDGTTQNEIAYTNTININAQGETSAERAQIKQVLLDPIIVNGNSRFSVYEYTTPVGHELDAITLDKKNLEIYLIGNNKFGVYFKDPTKEVYSASVSMTFINENDKKYDVDAGISIQFTGSENTLVNAYSGFIKMPVDTAMLAYEINRNEKDKFISATTDVEGVTVDENGMIKSSKAYEGRVNTTFTYHSEKDNKDYTQVSSVSILCS